MISLKIAAIIGLIVVSANLVVAYLLKLRFDHSKRSYRYLKISILLYTVVGFSSILLPFINEILR